MNKKTRFTCLFLLFLFLGNSLFSQKNSGFQTYESNLKELFTLAFTAKTDNERFNANEQAALLLEEALSRENSFSYTWDSLKTSISVLKSDDDKFKIFTWNIIRDNEEYDCFGYIQVFNEKTELYDVYALTDQSQTIMNPEEALLNETNWYGMVYYKLITIKEGDKSYYTLLGWTGNDCISQKKIIEFVNFKQSSTKPIFGQPMFYKDKKRRRLIFEYSKQATLMLRYDKQSYSYVKKKRTKNTPPVTEKIKEDMIVFDVLQPMVEGMEGIYQYYIPGGEENGFIFENGKWRLLLEIDAIAPANKKYDNYNRERDYKPRGKPIYVPKTKTTTNSKK